MSRTFDLENQQVPRWFRRAIQDEPAVNFITVDGCRIRSRSWGLPDRRGVVLVHGGAAHSSWWDHVGPLLASEYRVVALDLSGHGDSGRRERYDHAHWAKEVIAVSCAADIEGPPVLVGHSMGGWVALAAAETDGDELAGVMAIDSPVDERSPEEQAAVEGRAFGPLRKYPTRAAAVSRFRTIPEQEEALCFVVDHIAATSVREHDAGWTWKFDPAIFGHRKPGTDLLQNIACRVGILRAERGLVTAGIGARMYDLLGRAAPVVAIPEAGHHVMLDQPLALVAVIRALLADWEHSDPIAPSPLRPEAT